MFGSHRHHQHHQLSATKVSAKLLGYGYRYATILGFIWFGIKGNRIDGSLVAENRYCYKCFCLSSRLLITLGFSYTSMGYIGTLDNYHLVVLSWIRLAAFLICTCTILWMQLWCGHQLLRVVNNFLRLFRRVRALPGCETMGFGGKRELSLIVFKLMCVAYEFSCELPCLFYGLDLKFISHTLADMYTTLNAAMIGHVCFVGYLSVGALYAQVNRYVRHELRRQIRGLEQPNGVYASRRELRAAGYRLDECLAIYNEIQRVGKTFQRLFDFPLSLLLFFQFLSMTLVSYYVMLHDSRDFTLWLLVLKLFLDMVLLTLAVHGAGSSSRVIRRLSIENCYVTERNDWHMRLEIFLGRLNFFEFRVQPLGLFEISNELILVFLSGLVTYLTYILQYGIQTHQI